MCFINLSKIFVKIIIFVSFLYLNNELTFLCKESIAFYCFLVEQDVEVVSIMKWCNVLLL